MSEDRQGSRISGAGSLLANGAGILAALGIGFGGLFLVQNILSGEAEKLLHSGGRVEIPVQGETMTTWETQDVEAVQALLTGEELRQVVERLEKGTDPWPHEPWQGQMSMAEAMECGRDWTENFLMPHLGMADYTLQEVTANCYLWNWQADVESGEGNPLFGCWSVWLYVPDLTVALTLNGVTGQVLQATVSISGQMPVEYQEKDGIMTLLTDYGDSFGLGGSYVMLNSEMAADGWEMRQTVGEEGVYASVRTSTIAIADIYGDMEGVSEIFTVELGLGTE